MKEYRLGLYEKAMPDTLSLSEKLALAKRCGYDYVEISIDETAEKISRLDMNAEERALLCRQNLQLGISFESICLSAHRKFPIGSENLDIQNKGMEIMEKAIRLSSDIGIRVIQIAGYDVYYENSNDKTKKIFENNLKKCTELASMYGVILAFETMETEFINTVGKAMFWVNKMNSPYLCVYPDTGNITNAAKLYGENETSDLYLGNGHIVALHLKESLPGKYREVKYGTGHVDFKRLIDMSYDMGVKRFLAEFWYTGQQSYEDDIRNTNSFIRSFFS